MEEQSVAVISGPDLSGLTLGALLARENRFQLKIYEKGLLPNDSDFPIILWPQAVKVLKQAGVLDRIKQTATLTEIELRTSGDKHLKTIKLTAPVLAVCRKSLLEGMRASLPSANVRNDTQVFSYENPKSVIKVNLRSGETHPAHFLVASDGYQSNIRKEMFKDVKPDYSGYKLWRGIAEMDLPELSNGKYIIYSGKGVWAGVLSLGKGLTGWWAAKEEEFRPIYHMNGRKKKIQGIFSGWPALLTDLLKETPEESMLANFAQERIVSNSWHDGNVVLTGEAAHLIPMVSMINESISIEDAGVLWKALKEDPNLADCLPKFEMRRFGRINKVTDLARNMWHACLATNYPLVNTRDKMVCSALDAMVKEMMVQE